MRVIEARGLRKTYGQKVILDGINLRVEEGSVLGLIGANGAGKTSLLYALLGLTSYEGELTVLGRNPWTARDSLMCDVAFIADVAVLPRWMRVSQALDFMAGVHPRFNRNQAEAFLAQTNIQGNSKVASLSKGMVTQLHLALTMAIEARLLVLDEPTLGLDLPFRKQFYDSLLSDYFERRHTIVLATHEIAEVENILTEVRFLDRGRVVFGCSTEELQARYSEVLVHPDHLAAARTLHPMQERERLGRSVFVYQDADRQRLSELGEVRTPSLADLFVARLGSDGAQEGARR